MCGSGTWDRRAGAYPKSGLYLHFALLLLRERCARPALATRGTGIDDICANWLYLARFPEMPL